MEVGCKYLKTKTNGNCYFDILCFSSINTTYDLVRVSSQTTLKELIGNRNLQNPNEAQP